MLSYPYHCLQLEVINAFKLLRYTFNVNNELSELLDRRQRWMNGLIGPTWRNGRQDSGFCTVIYNYYWPLSWRSSCCREDEGRQCKPQECSNTCRRPPPMYLMALITYMTKESITKLYTGLDWDIHWSKQICDIFFSYFLYFRGINHDQNLFIEKEKLALQKSQ